MCQPVGTYLSPFNGWDNGKGCHKKQCPMRHTPTGTLQLPEALQRVLQVSGEGLLPSPAPKPRLTKHSAHAACQSVQCVHMDWSSAVHAPTTVCLQMTPSASPPGREEGCRCLSCHLPRESQHPEWAWGPHIRGHCLGKPLVGSTTGQAPCS